LRAPVQIEMSTVGISSSAKLLRQLLVVASEVIVMDCDGMPLIASDCH
jgi:hypothetical protein